MESDNNEMNNGVRVTQAEADHIVRTFFYSIENAAVRT